MAPLYILLLRICTAHARLVALFTSAVLMMAYVLTTIQANEYRGNLM
jgi:hypothetical protein